MITFLNVPFNQKEQARALGAKYSSSKKQWYVPDAVDLIPFLKWLNSAPKLSKRVKSVIKRKV